MLGTFKFDSAEKVFVFRSDKGHSVSYDAKHGWGVWLDAGRLNPVKVSDNLFDALEILESLEG